MGRGAASGMVCPRGMIRAPNRRSPPCALLRCNKSLLAVTSPEFQARVRDLAARCARAVQKQWPKKTEGAGKAGCPLHPQPVCIGSKHTVVTTGTPGHPAFPAQWFYGLYRALPGDEFVLVTVIGGLKVCRTRSGSKNLRQLDTSNGCQDHTVLPSAHAPFVCAPLIAHGQARPANTIARPTLPRPPHPIPRP